MMLACYVNIDGKCSGIVARIMNMKIALIASTAKHFISMHYRMQTLRNHFPFQCKTAITTS